MKRIRASIGLVGLLGLICMTLPFLNKMFFDPYVPAPYFDAFIPGRTMPTPKPGGIYAPGSFTPEIEEAFASLELFIVRAVFWFGATLLAIGFSDILDHI